MVFVLLKKSIAAYLVVILGVEFPGSLIGSAPPP
jgi:hypothetical protein